MLRKILLGFGAVIGLATVAVIVWVSVLPPMGVKFSNNMEQYALDDLAERELLLADEALVAYYDVTLRQNGAEAAVLTDHRLIYLKENRVTAVALVDVAEVVHRRVDWVGDVIVVETSDATRLRIEIAPLNNGGAFVQALVAQLERLASTAKISTELDERL